MAENGQPLGINPRRLRRVQQQCAREYHAPRQVTHEEASRVDAFTIGEHINFALVEVLIGKGPADDYRARLGK